MGRLYYLAYGSNLHPLRLNERVPSAQLLGTTELECWRLHFHKTGGDDSGKCNMVYTGSPEHAVFAAVYEMHRDEKPHLDRAEGKGYAVHSIQASVKGDDYECFTYLARETHINNDLIPFAWYHDLVVLGAQYHNMPEHYMDYLHSFDKGEDKDQVRAQVHEILTQKIRQYR